MKKRLIFLTKNFILILVCTLLLTGCASMDYIGSDFDIQNVKSIQTEEDFYFSAYRKNSPQENIDMTLGVTKTSVPDIYVIYLDVKNNNDDYYVVYQKDFEFSNGDVIPASSYINAFQSQETGAYAGMQAMAPTISNLARISNNFQPTGQEQAIYQQNTRDNLQGQIGDVTEKIMKKSLSNASALEINEEKQLYMFIRLTDSSKFVIRYKDLTYTFGEKTKF